MGLYLGDSENLKFVSGGVSYNLNIVVVASEPIRLLSSDNYILKDLNGLYLIAKESE